MTDGNGQIAEAVIAPDFKPTPPSRAYVSVRIDEVQVVEDILDDTPDWTVGCGKPRRVPVASYMGMRGSAKVRCQQTREEVLRVIDPEGKQFTTFLWRDPDGRTG